MSWLLLALGSALATPPPPDQAVWVDVPDAQSLALARSLGLGWDEGSRPGQVRLRGGPEELARLEASGLTWHPVVPATAPAGYPSADEIDAALRELAEDHEDLVDYVLLGWSEQGRAIGGVRIGAAARPLGQQRIFGAHHGDKAISAVVALDSAQRLAETYGSDEELTALLAEHEVWVVPVVNPDGYESKDRYNATGVDLNRNYAFEWREDTYRSGVAPFSEAETRAMRALSQWSGFSTGLSMHSGAANIGWVWNYTTDRAPEDALLESLAQTYADDCDIDRFWITNGADWYVTHGDTTDWAYGVLGTLDYTLELSETKSPDSEELPTLMAAHWPAVRSFLLWEHHTSVAVVDDETGLPLPAWVTLEDAAPLWTGPDGLANRPVPSDGSVQATVRAPGWVDASTSLSPSAPTEVRLQRGQLADLRPSPALLSRGGSGSFELDVDELVLTRAGEEDVLPTWDGGAWVVALDELSPGPWTLETDRGVLPRGLIVGEQDSKVELLTVVAGTEQIDVQGEGFSPGSRAWLLMGEARLPVPLEVELETETYLGLSLADVALHTELPVDLIVLSAGRQLAALDLYGEAAVDTGAPHDTGLTGDTGTGQDPDGQEDPSGADDEGALGTRPGCACNGVTPAGYPPLLALLALLGATTRRRSV